MPRMRLLFLLVQLAALSVPAQEAPPVKLFHPYDPNTVTAAIDTPVTDTAATDQLRSDGDVNLIVDPRIERLMELHAEHEHKQQGYRVQIFLGERKPAEDMKRTFLQKYPDVPAYISWLAPNFRLRVGDLRTKLEAESLLHQLKPEFPGSYIVPDEIGM